MGWLQAEQVVAIFSLPLLLTSFTGLLFYKRWWKRIAMLRLRSGGRVFFSDLHRLLGIWTLLFTFVIGATGIWYFVEIPLGWRPDKPQQTRVAESEQIVDRSAQPLSLSRLVEITKNTIPDFSVRKIAFPKNSSDPVTIYCTLAMFVTLENLKL